MKDYDPKKVLVAFAGVPLNGFAENTKVRVEYNEDAWTETVGTDGEVTRARSNDETGKITIVLAASSDSNDFLTSMHVADKIAGAGVKPLLIKDNLGRTLVVAANAYIKKMPDLEYGSDVGEREWVFFTPNLKYFAGGNANSGGLAALGL